MLHEAALKPFLETSGEFVTLRRDLHRHPELAFEEQRTSDIVAAKLEQLGIPAHRGLAGTGVVGTLKAGTGNRAIGLRADMDALPMAEANDFDYRSTHANKMHACGHDGHTAMLLAAAAELSARPDFDGTVYFIFQPAEENEGGAKVMIEDGLFDQFDMEAVYGMHNMPQLPLGTFVAQPGSLMAGFDIFNITVEGKGGHAAMPHLSNDPIPAAAQAVSALQSIVSRNADPLKSGVVSVTQIHSGSSFNVIPQTAKIAGCVRYLDQTVQDMIEQRITDILKGIGLSFDMTVTLDYERRYPPTINDQAEAEFCADVLRQTFGADGLTPSDPMMGSEDFAFMLQRKPGCYIWAGAGAPDRANADLHNPHYDFNDDLLPIGAAYWTQLVKQRLPLRAPSP